MALTDIRPARRSRAFQCDVDGVFAGLVVLVYAQAFHWVVPRGSDGFRLMLAALGAYAALRLITLRSARPLILRATPLLCLVALCVASLIWSDMPRVTLTKLATLAQSLVIAAFLATRFTPDAFIRATSPVVWAMITAGTLTALFLPEIGQSVIAHHGDSWSGIWGHRAMFAAVCVLALLVTLYQYIAGHFGIVQALCRLGGVSTVLYLCNSKMSLAAGLLAAVAMIIARFCQQRRVGPARFSRGMVVMGVVLGLAVTLPPAIALAPEAPSALGRDDTLSGRLRFWQWGMSLAERHAWTGAGYRTFWQDQRKTELIVQDKAHLDYHRRAVAVLRNGHNGYLDVYFDLGWAGVALFALWMFHWLMRLGGEVLGSQRPAAILSAGVFAYLAARNVTETVFLEPVELFWLLALWSYLVAVGFRQSDLRES